MYVEVRELLARFISLRMELGCQGWFPMTFYAEPSDPVSQFLRITFNSNRNCVETITFLMLTQIKNLTFIH